MVAWQEYITPGRFEGQTVIVTGAASGIGLATALRVARERGRVIASDLMLAAPPPRRCYAPIQCLLTR